MIQLYMVFCPFQKFKYILGTPEQGIHSYRFLNTATVDYVLSILLAMSITLMTSIPLVLTTIMVLSIGIISHMLFGVDTNTIKFIGSMCT